MNSWFVRGLAVFVAFAIVAGVATNVAWAIRHDDDGGAVHYETVATTQGQQPGSPAVVVVRDDGWHRHPGPFLFFPLFPLALFGILLLVFVARRGGGHGPGWGPGDRFREWHEAAHRENGANGST